MAYQIAEVTANQKYEEEITGVLLMAGAEGVSSEGTPLLCESILAGRAEHWDEKMLDKNDQLLKIVGYFPVDDQWENRCAAMTSHLAEISQRYGVDTLTFNFRREDDESWRTAWKEFYKTFRIGENFVITPVWEKYEQADGDIVITLDPGLAFGTGNHPTTGNALRYIEEYVKAGDCVYDLGCGSGILSIGAAKVGAGKVIAYDYDEDAILATTENVAINELTNIEYSQKDLLSEDWAVANSGDVVVANIVASVLIELAPKCSAVLKDGGFLIGGGIIEDKGELVIAAFERENIKIIDKKIDSGWLTILGRKGMSNE